MANGKIRFGKQSGGELALVIPDGVANTEVIVPESGTLVTKDYADLKVALTSFTGTITSVLATPSGITKASCPPDCLPNLILPLAISYLLCRNNT